MKGLLIILIVCFAVIVCYAVADTLEVVDSLIIAKLDTLAFEPDSGFIALDMVETLAQQMKDVKDMLQEILDSKQERGNCVKHNP